MGTQVYLQLESDYSCIICTCYGVMVLTLSRDNVEKLSANILFVIQI